MIVAEQNWQPMIDEIWNNRQIEDYDGSSTHKRDFIQSWTHSRVGKHISIEDVMENDIKLDGDMIFEIEDPRGQFEEKVIGEVQMKQLKSKLQERIRESTGRFKKILGQSRNSQMQKNPVISRF